MARCCRPGSVRTLLQGSVTMLPGFTEGQWWVQDAAAALPVRLFGDVAGKTIADLCAAPGGKTAQLAQAGARVTAIDRSPGRVARLRDNLARLTLEAETVVADAAEWPGRSRELRRRAGRCALLLHRHHPPASRRRLAAAGGRYRRADDAAKAAAAKGGRAAKARAERWSIAPVRWNRKKASRPSAALLAAESAVRRVPIDAGEVAGLAEILTADGDLRTLPSHLPHDDPRLSGLDGFYAARLVKS